MVFRWFKGRLTKSETDAEEPAKPPVGLGTIDLNPFGHESINDSVDEHATVMMPELEVSGETEAWSVLETKAGAVEGTAGLGECQVSLSAISEPALSDVNALQVRAEDDSPRFHTIPSLRREALRLRHGIDTMQNAEDQARTPELWKSYLRLVPTDQNGWLSLGEFHLQRGELSEAEIVFRTALEFQPSDALTSGALGHTLMAQAKFNEARTFLDVACQGMPEEMDLQESLLACLKSCGDADEIKKQGMVIDELRRGAR